MVSSTRASRGWRQRQHASHRERITHPAVAHRTWIYGRSDSIWLIRSSLMVAQISQWWFSVEARGRPQTAVFHLRCERPVSSWGCCITAAGYSTPRPPGQRPAARGRSPRSVRQVPRGVGRPAQFTKSIDARGSQSCRMQPQGAMIASTSGTRASGQCWPERDFVICIWIDWLTDGWLLW
jgi:hypothetical protein